MGMVHSNGHDKLDRYAAHCPRCVLHTAFMECTAHCLHGVCYMQMHHSATPKLSHDLPAGAYIVMATAHHGKFGEILEEAKKKEPALPKQVLRCCGVNMVCMGCMCEPAHHKHSSCPQSHAMPSFHLAHSPMPRHGLVTFCCILLILLGAA